jgi:hypothetical protein
MGGAYTAVAQGPTGFWWNPGGISQESRPGFEAAMRRMSFDRQAGYVAYVHPVGEEEAAIALSWVYAGVGDLFEVDLDGNLGDKFSDYTNAATFSFGRRFSDTRSQLGLSLGLNLRYAQHNIADISAYSIGFDLGAHVRYKTRRQYITEGDVPPEILFGVAVMNLNQKYPWSTGDYWIPRGEDGGASFEEKFPIVIRSGVAASLLKRQLLAAFDLVVDEKQGATWHVGAEGQYREMLSLRAGINNGDPAFGAGFRPRLSNGMIVLLDYAFATQPDAIDAEHVFSLGLRF